MFLTFLVLYIVSSLALTLAIYVRSKQLDQNLEMRVLEERLYEQSMRISILASRLIRLQEDVEDALNLRLGASQRSEPHEGAINEERLNGRED